MPTLNKLEYLDETKHLIKDALNTDFNCGITNDDTFRSYVDKIKSIYTNWPKVTAKGTELTFVAKNGKMVLSPFGNTQQETYTGQQLFNIHNNPTVPTYSEAITFQDDYIISDYNNTSSSSREIQVYTGNLNLQENTNYLCVCEIIEVSGNGKFRPITTWGNQNQGQFNYDYVGYDFSSLSAGQKILFTAQTYADLSQKTRGIRTIFLYSAGQSGKIKVRISILADTTITGNTFTYEPYVGEIPSPNSSYPQNVKVVTGNNTINVNFDDYVLNLSNYELCKIGDYEDYIFKDRFGTWHINKIIKKIVLNGSESYIKSSQSTETNSIYVLNLVDNNINTSVVDGYSNYFSLYSTLTELKTNIGFTLYTLTDGLYKYLGLSVDGTLITTIEQFKTWLSNNNVTIYLVDSYATDIDLTGETTLANQLNALENAMSSTGVNYIGSEHEEGNAPIVLGVTALQRGGN